MQAAGSEWIAAPPSLLWELVADVTRMGEWSPETYKAEWLDGATGPAVGARFRGSNRRGLQRWSTRPRVKVCEPGREFTFVLGTRHHEFVVWRYQFEPVDNGTLVTESVTVRGYALYGLLRPRRRERQLAEGIRTTLARLKRAAETS
jgi:hypothetical protein